MNANIQNKTKHHNVFQSRSRHFHHTFLMPHPKITSCSLPSVTFLPSSYLSFFIPRASPHLLLTHPRALSPSCPPVLPVLLHNPTPGSISPDNRSHGSVSLLPARWETRAFNSSPARTAGGNPPGLLHWNLSWRTKTRAINLQTSFCQRLRGLGI